jgi:hypothetical protein
MIGMTTPAPAQSLQSSETPAMRGLVLALQQVGVSAEQYVNDVKAQLAAKDARIAELLRLCGEPCKPLAEVKPEGPR